MPGGRSGTGSKYVGITAADALVFAMTLLQRVVPVVSGGAPEPTGPTAGAYSAAACCAEMRAAWRNVGITPRGQLHRMDVAEEDGLTPRQAAALRRVDEDEIVQRGA